MRAASTLTAIGAALWLAASSAQALGFGRVSNATLLGQPLNFAASVHMESDESLSRECVSAEVVSGDNKLQPGQVRVTLEGSADSTERSVRVTTSSLIDEPVVTVSVTLGCTAKVTRRFVAFVDPPLINLAQAVPAEALPPQRVDSQVAPIVAIVQGEEPVAPPRRAERPPAPRSKARAPVAPSRASGSRAATVTAAAPKAPPSPRRTPTVSRQPVVARAAPAGPRLELETAPAAAARSASAPPTGVVPPAVAVAEAASAPKSDEQAEQLARERQRIQVLEEGLATLRGDSQSTQKSLATLQARLKEAEAERYANPLVYALAWLSALLALAVAGLWWRQSRGRGAAQWWASPAPAPAAARAQVTDAAVSAPVPLGSTNTAADAFNMSTIVIDDERPARGPAVEMPATRPAPFAAIAPISVLPEPPRELSVEELIDLEQQAEFFIVLGQDEAAIELLMSHVRSNGGISPLPYLKLLEIYRRRGDHDAYQRIRERFNRRFNAYAPDWDADLQHGRALVEYPAIIERLQGMWSSPVRVMETLDATLFRRNTSDETFDLPAYRELLFLYSIARDLAEHGAALGNGDVDLLLPFHDHANEGPISRLSASTGHGEFQPSDMVTLPLDLDVSFGPAANAPAVETMPAALRRTPDLRQADSDFLDLDLTPSARPTKPGPTGNR